MAASVGVARRVSASDDQEPVSEVEQVTVRAGSGVDEVAENGELVGVAEGVVDGDEPARSKDPQHVGPVCGVGGAFGVQDDAGHRTVGSGGQDLEAIGVADLGDVGQAGAGEVDSGLGDPARVDLDADEPAAVVAGGVGEPDGGVAVGSTDLQDARASLEPDEKPDQGRGVRLHVAQALQPVGQAGVVAGTVFREVVQHRSGRGVHPAVLPPPRIAPAGTATATW
jgi:hypothetical protein